VDNSTEHVARVIPLSVERIKEKYQPEKVILREIQQQSNAGGIDG
jgi:hypothetical protein